MAFSQVICYAYAGFSLSFRSARWSLICVLTQIIEGDAGRKADLTVFVHVNFFSGFNLTRDLARFACFYRCDSLGLTWADFGHTCDAFFGYRPQRILWQCMKQTVDSTRFPELLRSSLSRISLKYFTSKRMIDII